jgi:transcriptional regulator with XRE-family HTH domain
MPELTAAHERLRRAREETGLTYEDIAAATGLSAASIADLEGYEDELTSVVSLAHLSVICGLLRRSPLALLFDAVPSVAAPPTSLSDLTEALGRAHKASGLSVEAFSDRVGWELKDALIDPSAFWHFTVDGLRDVCTAAGIDWVAVLGSLPAPES